MKNKTKLLVAVILMIITLASISFAAFFVSKNQVNDNKVLSGCFNTSFTENSASIRMDKALPLTNEQGLNTTPYSFTISNTCSINADYTVLINIKENSFSENYISYNYSGNEVNNLSTASLSNVVPSGYTKSYILGTGTLKRGKSETINIKLWLNELADYQNMTNKTFEAEIQIVSTVSTNQQYGDVTLAYTKDGEDTDMTVAELEANSYEMSGVTCSEGSATIAKLENGKKTLAYQSLPAVCTVDFRESDPEPNYLMLYDGSIGNPNTNQIKDITGGWVSKIAAGSSQSSDRAYISAKYNTDNMLLDLTSTYSSVQITTDNYINISNYKYIVTDYNFTKMGHTQYIPYLNILDSGLNSLVHSSIATNVSEGMYLEQIDKLTTNYVKFQYYITRGWSEQSTFYIYNIMLVKPDDWQKISATISVNPDSIDELLNNNSTQFLNNEYAVKYMVKNCTGEFMVKAINNSTFMTAYQSSPYKSLIDENVHWKKFITMAQS